MPGAKRKLAGSNLLWSPKQVHKCAALWRAVNGLFAIKSPLGTIPEEKGISFWFRISIWLRYDILILLKAM